MDKPRLCDALRKELRKQDLTPNTWAVTMDKSQNTVRAWMKNNAFPEDVIAIIAGILGKKNEELETEFEFRRLRHKEASSTQILNKSFKDPDFDVSELLKVVVEAKIQPCSFQDLLTLLRWRDKMGIEIKDMTPQLVKELIRLQRTTNRFPG